MDKECYLCKSKEQDEVRYGEFMTQGEISVHYFCLLLTSNLLQRGHDDQGFLGFLETDIREESRRIEYSVCCYCKKNSANISCCASRCYRSFHLVCGEMKSTNFQFVGTFKSYCDRHVTGKKVSKPSRDEICCICYENIFYLVGKFDGVQMIRAPCCKNGWFHKNCIASFAITAGYFFKCPLCNDSNMFRSRLAYRGVFIPDRDAAWELEPNAFVELLERPKSCSAKSCCAVGREAITDSNNLINCSLCGSDAIHRLCLPHEANQFFCNDCMSISGGIKRTNNNQASNSGEEETEDLEVNVCDDFGKPFSGNTFTEKSNILRDDQGLEIISKSHVFDRHPEKINTVVHPLEKDKNNEQTIFNERDSSVSNNNSNIIGRKRIHTKEEEIAAPFSKRVRLSSFLDRESESDEKCDGESCISEKSASGFWKNSKFYHVVVRLKKITNLETKQNIRRFSLNECVTKNTSELKTKRLYSDCSGTYFGKHQPQDHFEKSNKGGEIPRALKLRNKPSTDPIETVGFENNLVYREFPSCIEFHGVNTSKTIALPPSQNQDPNKKRKIETDVFEGFITEEKIGLIPTNAKTKFQLLRNKSEDFVQTTQPLHETIQRKSRHQDPGSVLLEQVTQRVRSLSEDLASNSIKWQTSMSNVIKSRKRCSLPYEIENNIPKNKTNEKCLSRNCKPHSANICDVYAYITPSYVKRLESQKAVTGAFSVAEDLGKTEPITPEIYHLFCKSSSHIPKSRSIGTVETGGNPNLHGTTNLNQTLTQTFLSNYGFCFSTTEKPQIHKRKKNTINQSFMRQTIPSNQTLMKSFFKKI